MAPQQAPPSSRISTRTSTISYPDELTEVNGRLFFQAEDGTHGDELWVSDGTAAGTTLVKDIYPGSSGSFPEYLTVVNSKLFFTAHDGTHGDELWKLDVLAPTPTATSTAGPSSTPTATSTTGPSSTPTATAAGEPDRLTVNVPTGAPGSVFVFDASGIPASSPASAWARTDSSTATSSASVR